MKLFNGILGVFAIIASAYCFWFPGVSFLNAGWIITILLAGWGACAIFETVTNKNGEKTDKPTMAKGVIALIGGLAAGVLATVSGLKPALALLADRIIIYVFIAWLLVSGLTSFFGALSARKTVSTSKWVVTMILGILTFLSGIYGICHVFFTAWTITIMLGALLSVYGFRLLASVFE